MRYAGTEGLEPPTVSLSVKASLRSEVGSVYSLNRNKITLPLSHIPRLKKQKTENIVLLLMPFHNGWTLLFTRYLTVDVDTMHGGFAKTTKHLLV